MSVPIRLLLSFAAPLYIGAALLRSLTGRESWADAGARLGLTAAGPGGPVVWVHGASNGELASARGLIERLSRAHPDIGIVITSNTTTGRDMARSWDIPRTHAALVPFDLGWMLRLGLRRCEPRALILLERDFWPGRHLFARRRAIPVVLASGAISARSAETWRKRRWLHAPVFGTLHRIWAQNAQMKDRFASLGVPPETFGPDLDLKPAYRAAGTQQGDTGRPNTWLAASTHPGEDETLLRAHALAAAQMPALRLILAPRHPRRADAIEAAVRATGLPCHRRSRGAELRDVAAGGVYLADTLGEMAQWYDASFACFVAGSLTDRGGHTPFEPAAHGCAIIHGSDTANFAGIYSALDSAGAAVQATTAEQIAQTVLELSDPHRARSLSAAARNLCEQASIPARARADFEQTLALLAKGPLV